MNPYPKTIIDEDSGREIPNFKHQIWEEGARFVVEWLGRDRHYAGDFFAVIAQREADWHEFLQEIGIETEVGHG